MPPPATLPHRGGVGLEAAVAASVGSQCSRAVRAAVLAVVVVAVAAGVVAVVTCDVTLQVNLLCGDAAPLLLVVLLWFAARACLQLMPEQPLVRNSTVTHKWLLQIDPAQHHSNYNNNDSNSSANSHHLESSSSGDEGWENQQGPTEAEQLRYAHMGILSLLPNRLVMAVFQVLPRLPPQPQPLWLLTNPRSLPGGGTTSLPHLSLPLAECAGALRWASAGQPRAL